MGNSVSRDLIGDVVFEDDQIAVREWYRNQMVRPCADSSCSFINILQSFLV